MRISDWSSDVCSSDLDEARRCLLVLPAMLASHSFARVAPSAGWPIDFDSLPPDWAQAAFTVGPGRTTALAAVAGSTLMMLSFEMLDTRAPLRGVFGGHSPLKTATSARTTRRNARKERA